MSEAVENQFARSRPRQAGAIFSPRPRRESVFVPQQVMKWIYHRHVDDFEQMTDLGKDLRAKLIEHAEVRAAETVISTNPRSTARTSGCSAWIKATPSRRCSFPTKAAARCAYPARSAAASIARFCSTATQGFNRNLSTAEIIGQVWVAAKALGNRAAPAAQADQCGDDGHGRTLAEFRQCRSRDEHHARRLGFGLGQQTRHLVDRRPGADDRQAFRIESDVSLAVSLHARER